MKHLRHHDSQRNRVYIAESHANVAAPAMPLDGSVAAAQAFADRITTSKWFEEKTQFRRRRIIVDQHRGSGAYALGDRAKIVLGNKSRIYYGGTSKASYFKETTVLPSCASDPWIIIHEIVHHMVPSTLAWHGPLFARLLLEGVGEFIGAEAKEALAREYREHKVDYSWVSIKADMHRPIGKAA
jgi:hypothetical protein